MNGKFPYLRTLILLACSLARPGDGEPFRDFLDQIGEGIGRDQEPPEHLRTRMTSLPLAMPRPRPSDATSARGPSVVLLESLSLALPRGCTMHYLVPSPDGNKVAVNYQTSANQTRIGIVWLDASVGPQDGSMIALADDSKTAKIEEYFSWGPDSSHFACVRRLEAETADKVDVYRGRLSGDGKVTIRREAMAGREQWPSISLVGDGLWLACSGKGGRLHYRGAELPPLPRRGTDSEVHPAWNPVHPKLIAYTVFKNGRGQIVVRDLGSSPSGPLEVGGSEWDKTQELLPSWSPDGAKLAFYSNRGRFGAQCVYWVSVALDSGRLVSLGPPEKAAEDVSPSTEPGNYVRPAWTPDSNSVIAFPATSSKLFPELRVPNASNRLAAILGGRSRKIDYDDWLSRGSPKDDDVTGVQVAGDVFCSREAPIVTFCARIRTRRGSRKEGYLALIKF